MQTTIEMELTNRIETFWFGGGVCCLGEYKTPVRQSDMCMMDGGVDYNRQYGDNYCNRIDKQY